MVGTGCRDERSGDRMLCRSARFASSAFSSTPWRVEGDRKVSWFSSRIGGLKSEEWLIYIIYFVLRDSIFQICCNISGILQHASHLISDGYILFAVATNRDIWLPTHCKFGIISEYLKLYIYFITVM